MSDMKVEFEKWAEFGCAPSEKALCWDAWQASRAALKVELPDALVPENNVSSKLIIGAYNALLKHVKEALQQAGIEVVK